MTPREVVAQAIFDAAFGQDLPESADDLADAALAALADHDGLVDVLRGHAFMERSGDDLDLPPIERCYCGLSGADHAAHLADVVRAWLRGETA